MVKVPPCISAMDSLPSRARRPSSEIFFSICAKDMASASRTTGTTRPVGSADGDAHVDEVLVDDIGAVDFCVDLGHFGQRVAAGFDEERHEAEFDAVLLFEQVFVFGAQAHHRAHVDLVIGGQHRGGVLGVFQAARDGLAQPGHLDAFLAGRVLGGDGRTRGGGGFGLLRHGGERPWPRLPS